MNEQLKELALAGTVLLTWDESAFQWCCRFKSFGDGYVKYSLQYFASDPEDAVRSVWYMFIEAKEKPLGQISSSFRIHSDIPF